jgi:hypothetical protein
VSGGAAGTPANGSISFYASGYGFICSGTLSGGVASCTSNRVYGGTRDITAVYNGEDSNFAASGSSPTYSHTINKYTLTQTSGALTGTAGTVIAPMTGSWTYYIPPPNASFAVPTGTVEFRYTSSYSGGQCGNTGIYTRNVTVTLDGSGAATRTESITTSEGGFNIYAVYSGDQNYNGLTTFALFGLEAPCG